MLHLNSDIVSIFHQAGSLAFRNFDIHIEHFVSKMSTFASIPETNYFSMQVEFLSSQLR